MKIDIHTHTRKIKSGDAPTRNIEKHKFSEILRNTDVKILAITNHNHFDLDQYKEFRDDIADSCLIWPGIELDIIENGNRSHLIVICNPKNCEEFSNITQQILKNTSPDVFSITIQETVENFDILDCIYIAHYLGKKPSLGDAEIDLLTKLVANPKRILKEAANSISAGIYISHGHNSIHGSDVQNWDDYFTISKDLPELRLPVESFEQFCLLLEKDEATIDTILSRKQKEEIVITPFDNVAEMITIPIYNDINILFGSKGSGKTDILEALSKHYNTIGHKTNVYKSTKLTLEEFFDTKGKRFSTSCSDLGIENCEEEIEFLKNVKEEDVTIITKYKQHFERKATNAKSQKLIIKNINEIDENISLRKITEIQTILSVFEEFEDYIDENRKNVVDYIDENLIIELKTLLEKILVQLKENLEVNFFDSKSINFVNNIIEIFKDEISKKTGQPPKPSNTGFADYSRNRIKIELAINKIIRNISTEFTPILEYAGSLLPKGELYFTTNVKIQNGLINEVNFTHINSSTKNPEKNFSKCLNDIQKCIYTSDLFKKISDLNEIDGADNIKSIDDLILFYRHFTMNNSNCKPSTGESSMILLHKELSEEKDIYIIDEPEKSLGNDYISDVIVPLLKEKALLGKIVIIATHDANIAVRTLPYNSIYRLYENGLGYTFKGNPFSNKLKCISSEKAELDWKDISMKTLEGGKEAFGERGKIYGN